MASINDRLDTVVGLRSHSQDLTARVKLLEDVRTREHGWRDRVAWLYAGAVTAAAGVLALLKALGKL